MRATLYTLSISNPGHSARLMLAYKGVETKAVDLLPGMHPLLLWLLGFRRGTVPAMKLGGRRVEGSLEVAQALDRAVPEPPLYPSDPARRAAVEQAERWGEADLQGVPRRIARYALAHDTDLRTWLARDIARLPLPRAVAIANAPVARVLAARVGANEAGARAALAGLPATLDHVDALLADGTIGGEQPNAADFQIAPSVRLLAAIPELADALAARPCDAWARGILPDLPSMPRSRVTSELTRT
ncbi:glutathione S-transferase family protein [Conexibacter woesei]|uniref:Glutathione S-transferase domain protein n=1 Tax=Conexibacter woesei (strain DSM 14684 / CCUG 47730 / CIP 108061 / JCM 11494 / NBRC 100937 / ID131577) TaxID=469383 RepID=D3FA00_CONWI|nr:glutathione S-transferase N-terminal domain-containing protein [Conexibacter woesei]ADB53095.1 Glutathione S-transferase domain protein [Conexibacter woesei DSM 14684]